MQDKIITMDVHVYIERAEVRRVEFRLSDIWTEADILRLDLLNADEYELGDMLSSEVVTDDLDSSAAVRGGIYSEILHADVVHTESDEAWIHDRANVISIENDDPDADLSL